MRALASGLRNRPRDDDNERDSGASRSSSHPKTHASARTAYNSRCVAVRPDETVRNAVAFLTQEDAESALIFALVHDPEFRLASALATVRSNRATAATDMTLQCSN